MQANQFNFINYEGGVLHSWDCGGQYLDHSITIVGYDHDGDDFYWLGKNSWGPRWGENGYIRLGYQACGVERMTMYVHTNDEFE